MSKRLPQLPHTGTIETNDIDDGDDLIEMIKRMIIQDQRNDKLLVEHLADDIMFLKSEMNKKNEIISDLMHCLKSEIEIIKQHLFSANTPVPIVRKNTTVQCLNENETSQTRCHEHIDNSKIERTRNCEKDFIGNDNNSEISDDILCKETISDPSDNMIISNECASRNKKFKNSIPESGYSTDTPDIPDKHKDTEKNVDIHSDKTDIVEPLDETEEVPVPSNFSTSNSSIDCSNYSNDSIVSNVVSKEVEGKKHVIDSQIESFRETQREKYYSAKVLPDDGIKWPDDTILVVGDSILCGIDEQRLGKKKFVKVRVFPGARLDDFFRYLPPLLDKSPSHVILHGGTNDAPHWTSNLIADKLLKLTTFIRSVVPNCDVVISYPVIRMDESKASLTIRKLRNDLNALSLPCITHDNITEKHLGKKGFHLNARGLGRIALNILACIRRL